ncbi:MULTISPECIES: GNAT family N-acetyltransferase [Psychrilyobacter]|uniref:GNAT family N-acetyltransferase n=1 Tax=Psychrilyobacter piezotolerans TaxID=2293438 RepID=A0ABX9KEB6_9FUSO|nr:MULTISPECIES: GNAT family N-acetyltransferase [Psychrilyobacter]MCS5423118.1 GNAT family N-acetyltransferase [Psychrilyobacter sp. S5]NDI78730.1 GNAT family N-acetyltransferase [Psychrilyobacter piezotolerans]RDE59579.1 GNAT family N-acetyltransferase [Psychrilyobacter sp. S5]REI39993.1 GNAT family N-acetyltransferase [Psychrilyobacter piezotolerans]
MKLMAIHHKGTIKEYLNRQKLGNFIYQCNNLGTPFWENTQWYGLYEEDRLMAVAMFVIKYDIPILLATSYCKTDFYQDELFKQLRIFLPKKLYTHLNADTVRKSLVEAEDIQVCRYYNMELTERSEDKKIDSEAVQQLSEKDTEGIINLLEESHPEYLVDHEFIKGGYFWGVKSEGKIISLAGITAKSEEFKIVSIGNITTHPDYRHTGLSTKTVTRLMDYLEPDFKKIVLNVKETNETAIKFYKKLGFSKIGLFDEVIFDK